MTFSYISILYAQSEHIVATEKPARAGLGLELGSAYPHSEQNEYSAKTPASPAP
jgi:hypothetical protein